jgi:hypothetical protein
MWPQVDRDRDLFPLAATIARNVLIDGSRRRDGKEIVTEVPDRPSHEDVERSVLSRLDLARVAETLPKLGDSQRRALLQVVAGERALPTTSATKMVRMRARRRLAHLMGAASAFVTGALWRVVRGADGHSAPIAGSALVATLAVLSPHPATAPQHGSYPARNQPSIVVAPMRELDVHGPADNSIALRDGSTSTTFAVASTSLDVADPGIVLPEAAPEERSDPREPGDTDEDPVEADGGIKISAAGSSIVVSTTEDGADLCLTIQGEEDCGEDE